MVKKIIKFSAVWCGPCRAFSPTFHKVEKMDKYKDITFEDIDIENDENGELYCEKYQIRTVPSTILLDENDKVLVKFTGNVSESDFKSIIDDKM